MYVCSLGERQYENLTVLTNVSKQALKTEYQNGETTTR